MSDKAKFPLAVALRVAEKIVEALRPVCARIEIAGSIRRRKEMVGDIEILYIPSFTEMRDPSDLFGDRKMRVNAADLVLAELMQRGSLAKRTNVNGSEMWGESNKLAVACKTGIPVDFFAANERNWWNLLVCRTGGKKSNMAVATAAIEKGYQWNPYSSGFSRKWASDANEMFVRMDSEEAVFHFVGLPCRKPEERE